MRMILAGITDIQEIGIKTQQELMHNIGVNEKDFARYQNELGPFMEEKMMAMLQPKDAEGKSPSLE